MLRPIPPQLIRPGFRLPGALRDGAGDVIVSAGTMLTEEHLQQLETREVSELYAGLDWLEGVDWLSAEDVSMIDEIVPAGALVSNENVAPFAALDDEGETVDVASLRPGMRLAQDLYDETDVLLLAAGMQVTSRFLDLLWQRKIKVVRLRSTAAPAEAAALQNLVIPPAESQLTRRIDEVIARETGMTVRLNPIRAWRRPRIPLETLREEAKRGIDQHIATSLVVAEFGETLLLGGKASAATLRASMTSFLNMVTLDFDLLPLIVSMQRTKDEYLFDHCVNVALLSMSVGAQLGLGQDEVMKIGLAGLLHDVGMLRVPGSIRLAPRELTASERLVVHRHPMHTLDMLEGIRGLPPLVRMIAFQVHERADGSGYPRGETTPRLHPYSMIVGVSDAYVAMTRPRPYRGALMPYLAAKTILVDGSENRFDRAIVRALLDSISLFPIGSIVELSNGRMAAVIRSNPDAHTKPVVEELDDSHRPTHHILDLSKTNDVAVVRAHRPPPIFEPQTSTA